MGKIPDIYDVLQPERVKIWLKAAFKEAGVTSVAVLKDDKKVERVAQMTYEKIPLIPFRAAIKAAIGKDGFTRVMFAMRDKMLEADSVDLSWLNLEYVKAILNTRGLSRNEPERGIDPELKETPTPGGSRR